MQNKKVYVDVIVKVDADGYVQPLSVIWADGKKFDIDKVIGARRAYASKVGGTGIRYTVCVKGKTTYLFEDEGKWFVEAKNE